MFCTHQVGKSDNLSYTVMLVILKDAYFFLASRGFILPSGPYPLHLARCVEGLNSPEALQPRMVLLPAFFLAQTSRPKFPPRVPSLYTVPSFLQPHPQHPIQHTRHTTYQIHTVDGHKSK